MQTDKQATDNIEQSVTLENALAVAISLHQSQRLDEAEEVYQLLLDQYPNYPEALHFYGLLKHQKGDSAEGINLIKQAIAEAPNYADAYNNLGNIFILLGQFDQAIENYQQTLLLNPDNIPALNNLGVTLKNLSRFDEALQAFTKLIALAPDNSEFYRNLANVYTKQCNFSAAAETYKIALAMRPYHAEDYENLCVVLYLQGKMSEAIPLIHQWLEHEPDNALALHRLHSFTGEKLSKASDDYIRETFDSFAESFDYVLKGLDYKAPFLVLDAVRAIYGEEARLTILDAGCGTGLCGVLLKPYAASMVGVDLSIKMLERAKARLDCYSELVQAELTAYINAQNSASFDLVVSGDTLVYFGDLSDVCQGVSKILVQSGYFIFTLECTQESPDYDFKINPHGRFSHTEKYIRSVLLENGFSVERLQNVLLRYEAGNPVNGFLGIGKT